MKHRLSIKGYFKRYVLWVIFLLSCLIIVIGITYSTIIINNHQNKVISKSNIEENHVVKEKQDKITKRNQDKVVKTNKVQPKKESLVVPCTGEEQEMMEYIVEAEARGLSYQHKRIIACVIVNRMYDKRWHYHNIREVIVDRNQFSTLYNVYSKRLLPNADTKRAVSDLLYGRFNRYDISGGAVFFYNPQVSGSNRYFEGQKFLYSLDGHRFFR